MALKCPELDDEYYLRLQEKKNSHASKSNIDSKEKSLLALQYKVLDIAKPLIYAMESKDSKKQRRAVKAALDLWGVAFYDITKARRKNILAQLNPNFLTLVDSPSRFSPKEFQSLFGRTFSRSLVTLAGNAATLRQVPSNRGGRGGRGGGNFQRRSNGFNGNRGGGHQNGRNGGWQQHSSQGNGHHNGRGYNNNGGNRNGNFQNNSNSNRGGYVLPLVSYLPVECSSEQLIIGGRLRNYARVWSNFTADPWVISSITEGVRLELLKTPVQLFPPGNPSMNETEVAICNEEVESLLRKGAIRPVNNPVFVSPFFCVPKPKGFRPIINLKALNDCLEYQHFQMEGLATARDLIRKGDWIAKLDLTDAYLTVPLHPNDSQFLQFRWMDTLYEYTCVAFGLASAPRVFTKLMKPLVAYFRGRGVRMVIYLDDILLIAETADSLDDHITLVRGTLESVGFVVNVGKSILVPTQQLEFLGFWLDSKEWILSLTTEKIHRIRLRCSTLLRSNTCSIRDLQSILGLLSWCIPAIPYAQANYRALQSVFLEAERQHPDGRAIISLPDGALKDLRWWIKSLESSKPLGSIEPDLVLYSDASSWGWGVSYGDSRTGGPWSHSESTRHINELELLAGFNALKCYAEGAIGSTIEICMDNTTAVAYVNKQGGTKSIALSSLAGELSNWCEVRKISLTASHIPGILNVIADQESRRGLDPGDWKLCPRIFEIIVDLWSPTVDLFAASWNKQLIQFVSWRPQPDNWKTDALSFRWSGIMGYAFPPFGLIHRCLNRIIRDQAELVMVCPYWPSRAWFPLILELACDVPVILPPIPDLLTSPLGDQHPLTSNGSMRLVAWRLSGNPTVCRSFRGMLSNSSFPVLERPHTLPTNRPGTLGRIGAVGTVVIPCRTG